MNNPKDLKIHRSNSSKTKTHYDVGKGKPPKTHRFKKGKSGNPRGRPKAKKPGETSFEDLLNETVTIKKDGKNRTLTKKELILLQVVTKAAQGDYRSTVLVLNHQNRLASSHSDEDRFNIDTDLAQQILGEYEAELRLTQPQMIEEGGDEDE